MNIIQSNKDFSVAKLGLKENIIFAFRTSSSISTKERNSIFIAVQKECIVSNHLKLIDAKTICDCILKTTGIRIVEGSVIAIEFGNNDQIVESIYGNDITSTYEKNGLELRLYYGGRNQIALRIQFSERSPLKTILWILLLAIAIPSLYWGVNKYTDIDRIKQEQEHKEKLLKDSIAQSKAINQSLTQQRDSIENINSNLKDTILTQSRRLNRTKDQLDSVKNTYPKQSTEKKNRPEKQRSMTTNTNSSVQGQRVQSKTRSGDLTNFQILVDKGDQAAVSYYNSGSDEYRRTSISSYEQALKIKEDSKVREKLNKLKKN